MDKCDQYAEFWFQLRQQNKQVDDVPSHYDKLTEQTAYAVQDKLVEKLLAAKGGKLIGYKIGCTSKGAQQLLSTDGPVYGRLLSTLHHPSPMTLSSADFSMLVIEPEFAFTVADHVPVGEYDAEGIRPFVSNIIPSIEIVHHRLGGWDRFDALKTIADNAIHGAWVGGTATEAWEALDLPNHEVTLFADEIKINEGFGHVALGNPLNALAWLANKLPQHGRSLQAGDIVTTGVCMDVYTAQLGQTIRADFGSLGNVSITFS